VISRYDVVSLRLALVVAHIRPGVSMLVTIFDRDVAAQVERTVDNVRVLSMADIVAPALAGPCIDPGLISVTRAAPDPVGIVAEDDGEPRRVAPFWRTPTPLRRLLAALGSLFRPFDAGARIMVAGLLGVLGVLVLETAVTIAASGMPFVDALYSVAKVTVTAGPSRAAESGAGWFKVFSTVSMLLTLGFTAVLTAGLVNRLLDRRLTGVLGRAAVPRRDHVIVVGLGQVGLRLCLLLRELGVPVVAVEQNENAQNLARAKDQRLPVVVDNGRHQRMLRRLSINRARALAAVTSDEVENIAITVGARGVRDDLQIALRAGAGDATSETRSLFRIAVVRDVFAIGGATLAAVAMGHRAHEAFIQDDTVYLVDDQGEIEPFPMADRLVSASAG
jgi:voltage-gated potassium channel Kch